MRTRYRYINFVKLGADWHCHTNAEPATMLGFCEFYARWRQWQFVPRPDTAFTSDCCRDIADFLDQLKREQTNFSPELPLA